MGILQKGLKRMLLALVVFGAGTTALSAANQSDIEAPGPKGPLKGTLLMPKPGAVKQIVLIIPGSGPTDRDGNGPLIKASTYKYLANALASADIASARIDKRGLFASASAVTDANAVIMADYAKDVHAWISSLQQRMIVPCVWLLGHSEGGLVSLVAAQQAKNICGLILAATPGRRVSTVLRDQMRQFAKTKQVLDEALAVIELLENGKTVETTSMHPALKPVFRAEVQGFMISLMSIRPTTLIANVQKPVLVLQGKRDLQVSVLDAKALAKANRHAKLALIADTNHLFKTVKSDDMVANLQTYGNPHLPLSPGVSQVIVKFIQDHSSR